MCNNDPKMLLLRHFKTLGMTQPSKSDEFSDKVQRGGSFPIQKIMLQIFGVILRENNDEFSEKGGSRQSKKFRCRF